MAFSDWWGGKTWWALPMVPILVVGRRYEVKGVDPYCWAGAPWLIFWVVGWHDFLAGLDGSGAPFGLERVDP